MPDRRKVFISYRRVKPDEDVARELAASLEAPDIEVFLDTKIAPGDEWSPVIESKLTEATHFVVLVSNESMRSPMVVEELRRAHGQRSAGRTKILPVILDDVQGLPYEVGAMLNPLQRIQWQPGATAEVAAKLRAAILTGATLPIAATPPPPPAAALDAGPPLSSASTRLIRETGTMPAASPFYVRRAADERLERQLTLLGRTVVVRGPRQSGKSSLLARAQQFAATNGARTVPLDFQGFDGEFFSDIQTFVRCLGGWFAREFSTARTFDAAFDPAAGPRQNLRRFVEREVLTTPRTVLLVDEVDLVLARPWRQEFFSELRVWHNLRASGPPWNTLTIVLFHSTDPALWIDPSAQSPFNVAHESLWLEDFSESELSRLNELHGSPVESVSELRRVFGGHPYLARLALYTLGTEHLAMDRLAEFALQPRSPFSEHLRRHLHPLRQQPDLAAGVRAMLDGRPPGDESVFDRLFSMGLVGGSGPGDAHLRCELYEHFLRGKV